MSCIHGPTFSWRIYDVVTIWQCNEFDDYELPPERRKAGNKAVEIDARGLSAGDKSRRGAVQGLCINCENRDDCLLPRPEGRVWHCEELSLISAEDETRERQ